MVIKHHLYSAVVVMLSAFMLLPVQPVAAQKAPVLVQVNSGSRAPYGNVQDLTIDNRGQCIYYLTTVKGALIDSMRFNLRVTQVDSFLTGAVSLGFFKLRDQYKTGSDGAGVYLSLNNKGSKHSVDVKNQSIPEVDQVVALLNRILQPHNVWIYYGQKEQR